MVIGCPRLDTPSSNRWTIYWIVGAIIIMAAACVGTNCYMALNGKEAPQAFTLLTGGLVGAVTSMLVKTTPTETVKSTPPTPPPNGAPAEVVVTNKPDDPVPTTETKV